MHVKKYDRRDAAVGVVSGVGSVHTPICLPVMKYNSLTSFAVSDKYPGTHVLTIPQKTKFGPIETTKLGPPT